MTPHRWRWLSPDVLRAVHEEQLVEHGGAPGTRDEALFESALSRPQNLALYGDPDVFDLAASYAIALAKNHPFVDGNKRTAFVAMELFLLLNGQCLVADDGDCVTTMLGAAAGDMPEGDLAQWLRRRSQPA